MEVSDTTERLARIVKVSKIVRIKLFFLVFKYIIISKITYIL